MPLRFEDDPALAVAPLTPPGQFAAYVWATLRNRILFRLLARHGTIVASTLEFTATDPVRLTITGTQTVDIDVHGGFNLKVNAPTERRFFNAPYLRNPYQSTQDNVHFSSRDWKSAQPLLMVGTAEQASAMLSLDRERMGRGPFAQDAFEQAYEPLKSPVFRYFIKHPDVLAELLSKVPALELNAGVLSTPTEKLLAASYLDEQAIQDLSAVEFPFNHVKRSQLGHLVEFHRNPAAFPDWRDYGASEARRHHHLHKSHLRLDKHYVALDQRVGQTQQNNTRPLTEARGEYLAAKVMAMVFAGERFELKMGFGDQKKAQGIDQIWARRHPKTQDVDAYFIVEAKGSKGAKYGQNKEETQMSPGWVFKKLVELASSPQEDERLHSLARKILGAMFNEGSTVPVFGMTFKSIFDKDHVGTTATRFNLQISKPLCFSAELKLANDTSLEIASETELFGTNVFSSVHASDVSLIERVPDTGIKLSHVPVDLRFGKAELASVDRPKGSFDFVGAYHPEHPRNIQLIQLLAAHSASILSVQDYFGVDPKSATVNKNGELLFYSGFATTAYGKDGHQHLEIDALEDPSDQTQLYPGALLIETDDTDEALEILAWKRSKLRGSASIAEPAWKKTLQSAALSTAVAEVLGFFAMRPRARQELKRILTEVEPQQRLGALTLAFPGLGDRLPLISKQVKVGEKVDFLYKFLLRLNQTGDLFLHHEGKSLDRLDKHYQSLEKLLKTSNASTALTEASGEFLGARAMAVIFGKDKLQLKMGHGEKKGSHGIDQIWARRNESSGELEAYFLVECKGSKHAELGQNVRESQMSPAWVFKKLLELTQDPSTRLKNLARKVMNAMFDTGSAVKVHGVIIQSLFDGKKPRGRFNIRVTSRLHFPDLLELANDAWADRRRGQKTTPHVGIRHDRMPLSRYLPDFKSVSAIQAPSSNMEGKVARGGHQDSIHHETVDGFLLTVEHRECLQTLNLKTKWVSADGDCAYNTVIVWLRTFPRLRQHLGMKHVPSVDDLKKAVVDEITQSPAFATQFLEPGQSLDDLKKKVRKRHWFFGSHGDIVLPALAKRLRLRIHVINPSGGIEDLNRSFNLGLSEDPRNGAPMMFAVLTSYMGIPENVAHYYAAIPLPQPKPQSQPAPVIKRKLTPGTLQANAPQNTKKARKGPEEMDEDKASPPPSSGPRKKPPPGGRGGGFPKASL